MSVFEAVGAVGRFGIGVGISAGLLATATAILWWKNRLNWSRERAVRRVLRGLARQRIAMILQPGNVWVIEKALSGGPGEDEALRTCQLRGWIETIGDRAIPAGKIDLDKPLKPFAEAFTKTTPFYRITSAGWDQINRTHTWVVGTFIVSLAALTAAIVGTILRQ